VIVNHDSDNHLFQIRTVIFTEASLPNAAAALTFKINRGSIEEHQLEFGKKILVVIL